MTTPAMLYLTAGSGNSFGLVLMPQQLGLDVLAGGCRSPAFPAINPRGRAPCLQLQDGRGVGGSSAMTCFLAGDSPPLPADSPGRAQALPWMFCEQTMRGPIEQLLAA